MLRYSLGAVVFTLLIICVSCIPNGSLEKKHLLVNPFIGTGGHGHTFPGPTLPFGMMQVGPDTRLEGWDGCSGYHDSDNKIFGFSHTHLSGTGISDYGDILFMPYSGPYEFNNGSTSEQGYSASFNKETERAHAGFYSVFLEEDQILVELTCTERSAFHRYTFKQDSLKKANVIIDLEHRDKVLNASFEKVDNYTVKGWRQSSSWAKVQDVYFYTQFNLPIDDLLIQDSVRRSPGLEKAESSLIKANLRFDLSKNQSLLVKVGISNVDYDGAKKNLEKEIKDWNFDKIKKAAELSWDKALSKIIIKSNELDMEPIFYTALYHSMIAPNQFTDVDGRYRRIDRSIGRSIRPKYTVFSLWDTHRALHPLFTIIEQNRTSDLIETLIDHYHTGGKLSKWELAGNYTNTMVGYHAVSVIADAYMKEIRNYDTEEALKAMVETSIYDEEGLGYYIEKGYIPSDLESESVSKTLEYSYDDWCIAIMAQQMGKENLASEYFKRSQFYQNLYDPSTGFMRARSRNAWFGPFDPFEVNFNYTEANAWQYNYAVPHDISGLITLKGGTTNFEKGLDEMFEATIETSGRDQDDITGLIGQYAHGNEPSHHMAYLYNFTTSPWKTQELTNRIIDQFYKNEANGLIGNEDCGQMSAWLVFSALGFYPVTPGFPAYTLTSPRVEYAEIHLENQKKFIIKVHNLEDGIYIQKVSLNGLELKSPVLTHAAIMSGGLLEFSMGAGPNPYLWPENLTDNWSAEITADFCPSPYIIAGERNFYDSTLVAFGINEANVSIYYTLNGADPKEEGVLFEKPIRLENSATFRAIGKKGQTFSHESEMTFSKIPDKRKIRIKYPYANQYSAGGDRALIDFENGGADFKTGSWQGYEFVDLEVEVSLEKIKTISQISIGFLQDQDSWIFFTGSGRILLF